MAATNFTPISLYYSTTAAAVPLNTNLVNGELSINITDGKLYYKDNTGTVKVLASSSGALGDVVGPASATDTAIALFDGTTGKLIKNSLVTIGSTGNTVISGTDNTNAMLRITQLGTGNSFVVEDATNPDSTPFVIDPNGRTIIGGLSSISTAAGTPQFQIQGTSPSTSLAGNYQFSADAAGPTYLFTKGRGAIGAFDVVSSGDVLGTISFLGADGTAFIRGASISALVDGTPGVGDMPGRLIFNTTADGAASPTERMRIDSAGNIGIGVAPSSGSVRIGKAVTGGTTAFSLGNRPTIQSDVTVNAAIYDSFPSTAASTFTLANLNHYTASQSTFGAGSTVTLQVGFNANSTIIGSANNYGFYGNISNATQRTITTVDRTTNVVTITTSVAHGFTAGQQVLIAAVTNTSVNGTFTIASVPTTSTLTYAQAGTDIVSVADTGTVNSAGRFNFYANGTAPNYFAGNVGIGVSPSGSYKLEVTGKTYSSGGFVPRPTSITSAATITPTSDASDQYNVTALATAATIASPSGTPTDAQKLIIRIKDNGVARALTWTTGSSDSYRAIGVTLPTTTVISKTVYIGCIYNLADLRWDVVSVAQEA